MEKINYDDERPMEKVELIKADDVKRLLTIAKSEDLSDKQKAMALYEYCEMISIVILLILHSLYMKLIDLKKYYVKYEKVGYFKDCDNVYKCSSEELNRRIADLKVVSNILLSEENDYSKVEFLLTMYRNADDFKRLYVLMVKNGKDDPILDSVRFELDHFDLCILTIIISFQVK